MKVFARCTIFARALGVEFAPHHFGVSFLAGRSFSFGSVGRLSSCGFVACFVDTGIVSTIAVLFSLFGLYPLIILAFALTIRGS